MSDVVTNDIDLLSVTVVIDGTELPGTANLVEVEVKKEINKIPTATVVILDGSPHEVEFQEADEKTIYKPGSTIKISAGYHQKVETIFEGIILSHNGRIKGDDISEVVLKCVDKAAKMTVLKKNRYFPESKDVDVIGKIIGEYGLTKKVDSTTHKHETMIQFDVTDFDFVVSRAEMNGLIVVVDDGKVNVVKPTTSDKVLTLTHGTDIAKMDLEVDARFQYKKVTAHGWNMSTNKIDKATSAEPSVSSQGDQEGGTMAGILGADELIVHTSAPIETEYLQSWADAKLLRSRLARIRGKIKIQGNAKPKPNTTVELKGVQAHLRGEAFVGGVIHKIKDHTWETEIIIGLTAQFASETQRDMQSPAASGMMPALSGLQISKVQKIDADPLGENRVKLDIPVIAESGDGVWARQSVPYATKDGGFFWIPEVGDECIVGFLNDDPRYPVIMGSVPSKSQKAAYTPDSKNTFKAITTNGGKMKIEFEDIKKIITITTPAGNKMTIDDDKKSITIEDEHTNKMVMDKSGFKFTTPKDFVVEATGNIQMKSTGKTEIKATQDFTADGLNVTTKAQVANSMKGVQCEVNGSAMTTVKGGMVMIN